MCNRIIFVMLLVMAVKVRAECERPFFGENRILADKSGQQPFPDGATVKFRCSTGYVSVRASASRSVTCNGTQWSELQLQCKKKSCGNPGDILHGSYQLAEDVLFGAVITAQCNQGYHLLGPPARHCRENGWDKRAPVCESVKCKKPLAITNGVFEPEMELYEYGDGIQYSCNRGFDLFGEAVLTCSSDETFQPALPQCLSVSCEKPEILHAHRTEGKSPPYKYREFVRYECNEDYKMEGSGFLTCTEKGWNPAPPRCNEITCDEPNIPSAFITRGKASAYKYKSSIQVQCFTGNKMQGSGLLSCGKNGWNSTLPKCSPVTCSPPPAINNGQFMVNLMEVYKYRQTVTYSCDEGYTLHGASIISCIEQGQFQDPPQCLAETCDKPDISNGFIIGGEPPFYKLKSSVRVQCNSGYSMTGSDFLTCKKNGWDPPFPHCRLDYWIWIMLSLAVLFGAVGVCCCLKKDKLSEFVSPKKTSDDIFKSDQGNLVRVSSGASPAEEILLRSHMALDEKC